MNSTLFWTGAAALGLYFLSQNQPKRPQNQPYKPSSNLPTTQPYTNTNPNSSNNWVDNVTNVTEAVVDVIDTFENLFGGDKEPVQDKARPQYYDAYEDTGLPNDTIA